MNGRGAVEMVVAAVVIKLSDKLIASNTTEPLLTQGQFSALICMAFITTIIAPLSLKWTVKKYCTFDENVQFSSIWEKSKEN